MLIFLRQRLDEPEHGHHNLRKMRWESQHCSICAAPKGSDSAASLADKVHLMSQTIFDCLLPPHIAEGINQFEEAERLVHIVIGDLAEDCIFSLDEEQAAARLSV